MNAALRRKIAARMCVELRQSLLRRASAWSLVCPHHAWANETGLRQTRKAHAGTLGLTLQPASAQARFRAIRPLSLSRTANSTWIRPFPRYDETLRFE